MLTIKLHNLSDQFNFNGIAVLKLQLSIMTVKNMKKKLTN